MTLHRLTRRTLAAACVAAPFARRVATATAQEATPSAPIAFSFPIGLPGAVAGEGFIVRHGYAVENTWYNPGWFHTAEDWYLLDDAETAGAGVYAIADGEVVYAGADYPGPVVILRHADDLYSMYGHLDYALAVTAGPVVRGQQLGTVLYRTDGRAPSHLHFEVRTFFTTPEVNGEAPRYDYSCGYNCPPGPGYWPMDAPEHPTAMGWRNPTHVIGGRMFSGGTPPDGSEAVVATGAPPSVPLWSDPEGASQAGELALVPGDRYSLLAVDTGPEDSAETSAGGYRLWYQVEAPGVGPAWVQAALPDANDTMSDGRPASIRFTLLPAIVAP